MKKACLLSVLALSTAASAAVKLATPFADGMVLQRGMKLPVWGTADGGEPVKVSFAGHSIETVAGEDGKWMVTLPPLEASRDSRELKVNDLTVSDVLVGEVWFVCGQSNAEMPLWGTSPRFRDRNGALVAQMTMKPLVRMCYASNYKCSKVPKETAAYKVKWERFTPETLGKGHSFSAMGAYFALDIYNALEIPVGVVGSYWGGTCIEPWIPAEGFAAVGLDPAKCIPRKDTHQHPSVLWNEMVNPWAPMAMRGFIWYQGCSNSGHPELYTQRMHALYKGWSKKFGNPALKLYFVQLAPWSGGGHPEFQQAQARFDAEEPNAAMAVINDLGNLTDIHPNEKETVAKRLSVHALKRDYGFDWICDNSPTLKSWQIEGNKFVLEFNDATGFYIYNHKYCSMETGMEICGEDGVWKKARIANLAEAKRGGKTIRLGSIKGARLEVVADEVEKPVKLRYLYSSPWYGSIYSLASLPLGSFFIDSTAAK